MLADEEEREAQRLALEACALLRSKVEAKAALLDQLDDVLARETLSLEARGPHGAWARARGNSGARAPGRD
jgi:hypothetical protein